MERAGAIYHQDLEIEWDPPSPVQHVLSCEVFNLDSQVICKYWSKNYTSIQARQRQHYLKIQHFDSYSPLSIKHATLVGLVHSIIRNCTDQLAIIQATTQMYVELTTLLGFPKRFVLHSFCVVLLKTTTEPLTNYIRHCLSKL